MIRSNLDHELGQGLKFHIKNFALDMDCTVIGVQHAFMHHF